VIKVGTQNAKNIVNAENSSVYLTEAPERDLERLRQQVRELGLRPGALAAAEREMGAIGQGLASPRADKPVLAKHVQRLTQQLRSIGALATAGQALEGPLHDLTHWISQL
jgi:hypothetical protein